MSSKPEILRDRGRGEAGEPARGAGGGAAQGGGAQRVEGVERLVVALIFRAAAVASERRWRCTGGFAVSGLVGKAAHGDGELAGGEAVDGGDLAGQRAERGEPQCPSRGLAFSR